MGIKRGACARCGRDPAEGYARINGVAYCHGDSSPSCYEQETWVPGEWRPQHPFADFVIEPVDTKPPKIEWWREGAAVHYRFVEDDAER